MDKVGFDGFEWEEVAVDVMWSNRQHSDLYLYTSGHIKRSWVKKCFVEQAGLVKGDMLQLFAQGSSIFMLKKSKTGNIKLGKESGQYQSVGGKDFHIKMFNRANATEFEVLEAADGYILFRPIR